MTQSTDERLELIKAAFDKAAQEKALDLNNISFAAISNADNSELTSLTEDYIKNG